MYQHQDQQTLEVKCAESLCSKSSSVDFLKPPYMNREEFGDSCIVEIAGLSLQIQMGGGKSVFMGF